MSKGNSESNSDGSTPIDVFAQWTEGWRAMAAASGTASETWSKSILPFMLARATESKSGFGAGNELAETIERMTQGPRLADAADFDRKLVGTFAAWADMQSKLAAYNAVAARPWMRAMETYRESVNNNDEADSKSDNWRDQLSAWTAIANDELLANQRTNDFLIMQKELLQAATTFRAKQTEIGETVSRIMGLPTQSDFDDVTRQLTELRREVRALSRRVDAASSDRDTGDQP